MAEQETPSVGMADYVLSIMAECGYEAHTAGRCTAEQYGAALAALRGTDKTAEQALIACRAALASALEQLEGWVAWKCAPRYKAEHTENIAKLRKQGGLEATPTGGA